MFKWIPIGVIALLFPVLLASPAVAHHPFDAVVPKNQLRVIDGDTVHYGKTRVRASNYDTPEKGTLAKCDQERAISAKATARFIELTSPPHVFTLKWGKGKDRYGRGLAQFYSDHKEIGPMLIAEGLAQPYSGGTKPDWCAPR